VNTMKFQNRNDRDILSTIEFFFFFSSKRERENENENENEQTAIFRIGRKTKFQQRNAIKSLPLTLKTPIISIAKRPCFYSANEVCLMPQNNKKLAPSKIKVEDTKKRGEEKNAKRSVGSFSRFPDFCDTFFSSLSLPSSLLVVFSLSLASEEHRISHPIVFLARAALGCTRERQRETKRRKKSIVAITNNNNNNKV